MANLFQVNAPVMGLMGQRRQTAQSLLPLLAGAQPIPVYEQAQFDEGDQMFLDRYARQGFEGNFAPQPQPVVEAAPQVAPAAVAPRQRERVSGWRLLDRVLGGQTITEGLDAERARLQQIADAPLIQASREQILSSITDPRERALFLASPEDWAKNVGQQFAPQVVSPGGIQAIGGRAVVGAPQQYEFGDTRRSFNPVTGADTVIATRGPTIAEQINMDKLALDAELGRGRLGVDQQQLGLAGERLNLDRQNSGFTLGQGQQRFDAEGRPVAGVSAAPSAQNQEVVGQLQSLDTEVQPALGQMRQLLESGQVITGFGADARLTAARALAATGNREAAAQVAATEQYRNLSGRLRVGMAKSLGANPSNADIQLLERVTAGDINQSREGLLATIADGEALANRQRAALRSRAPSQGQSQQQGGGQVSREEAIAELRRRGLIQ